MHFVGNVEGGDLFSGSVDVIVSDGFVGNIALKICEGLGVSDFRPAEEIHSKLARVAGWLSFFARRVEGFEEDDRLHGVRRRAAFRCSRRLRHRPRPLQCQSRQKRHSRGRGTFPRSNE